MPKFRIFLRLALLCSFIPRQADARSKHLLIETKDGNEEKSTDDERFEGSEKFNRNIFDGNSNDGKRTKGKKSKGNKNKGRDYGGPLGGGGLTTQNGAKSKPPPPSSGVKAEMDELIQSKAVLLISKSYCPYSKKAKQVLAKYNIDPEKFEVIEIDQRKDMDKIQAYMKKLTGASSVPRVFIGGRCIGGGDETAAAHKNGKLEAMLKDADALLERQD